jgi:hypothetical protein
MNQKAFVQLDEEGMRHAFERQGQLGRVCDGVCNWRR